MLEIDWNSGNIDKRYEYGDDLYCQVSTDSNPLDTPEFFLYDGLGSTRSLTDSDGELAQSYNYHPFGETINAPQSYSTNHLFTGEYFDQDLSYYYLRARYYAPTIGRFTSFDPVEDYANRLHKYAYCANDPICNIDPSGRGLPLIPGLGFMTSLLVYLLIAILVICFIAMLVGDIVGGCRVRQDGSVALANEHSEMEVNLRGQNVTLRVGDVLIYDRGLGHAAIVQSLGTREDGTKVVRLAENLGMRPVPESQRDKMSFRQKGWAYLTGAGGQINEYTEDDFDISFGWGVVTDICRPKYENGRPSSEEVLEAAADEAKYLFLPTRGIGPFWAWFNCATYVAYVLKELDAEVPEVGTWVPLAGWSPLDYLVDTEWDHYEERERITGVIELPSDD